MTDATAPQPAPAQHGNRPVPPPYPAYRPTPPVRPPGAPPWPAMPTSAPAWPTGRVPSGLFPSAPSRPAYREPMPARTSAVLIGAGSAALWMLLFGLIGRTARGYAWWSITAGLCAWLVAIVLARTGDRGVAAGVAISSAIGVAIVFVIVMARWIGGHWLLW